ncbi:MAG: GNAT family N-acetyltransferase [Bryobacteraceae bacterium]
MQPQIQVRPAAGADVAAIARIYGHYVLHSSATFEIEPPSAEEMAARRSGMVALGLPYLVAESGGGVVGYAYASPYRPRAAYRFTVEDSVYVDPEQVGRGYGCALLGALIGECRRGPWRQMIAVIGGGDNEASIRLHRRFAFREAGTLAGVGCKFNRWIDTILIQRELLA